MQECIKSNVSVKVNIKHHDDDEVAFSDEFDHNGEGHSTPEGLCDKN